MNIRVDWSEDSVEDLNFIFERIKKKTVSEELARILRSFHSTLRAIGLKDR